MSDPPASPRRWPTWALILAAWILIGLAYSTHLYVYHSLTRPGGTTYPLQIAEAFADFGAWVALTPGVLFLARRFPLRDRRWPQSLVVHIAAALVVALVQVSIHVVLDMGIIHGEWTAEAMAGGFRILFARTYHFAVLVYLGVVAVHQVVTNHKAQAVRAANLESALVRARLEALERQLHPHFLFNTLHAISALMQTDVKAADQMLARLADLLRATLSAGSEQEVPLRSELSLLDLYLDIEKIRFRDRLSVVTSIDPEALDARVPNLILQPLVENAIRHGIARKRGPGTIEIKAARNGAALELTVTDDGPGPPEQGLVEGIGLSNTRGRLDQLHGPDQSLTLRSRPGGGTEVVAAFPFHSMV